jgi:polysaccharide export outer membrane protein
MTTHCSSGPGYAEKKALFWIAASVVAMSLNLSGQLQAPRSTVSSYPTTQQPALLTPQTLPGPSSDGVISPDDVLDIYIIDVPELSRQYRVSDSGTVLLPLFETPLTAAGMKVTDFASVVTKELRDRGIVSQPHVTVSIAASRLQSISITGAVRTPQIYQIFGRTTLLDVLSQAQGLSDDASNIAVISRGELGIQASQSKKSSETVDLNKLLQSGDSAYNISIYPGDRVTVPRAGIVYVVGAVNKPGGFPIKQSSQGMTVLQALAFAEDTKQTARGDKTMIIRLDASTVGGHRQVPLNLKKIIAGKAEDPVLQADDILFIPDSQGKKALSKGLETALSSAALAIVYHPPF